ncbi:Coenzyme F420 hydrogenase/dehydrogenase, beta subunit C-terminal domain [Companilactobacillus furfuricola]|uniref:Coenzyme F420 hydrogenase/dehydrogenase, beta subunit C-terminal domain n=1 Tax=Companilactobacillus furfuricola TaxID=1462575 RepID=UPI000F7B2A7E|nr:Coenzyme F420 hydrogenase/dehydrogenase, beta subunit C-terminal domain [Companilactobacillus furfuricola]
MSDFADIYDKIVKNKYDFGTGSWAVVNDNIEMKFDKYGEYHPYQKNQHYQYSEAEVDQLRQACLSTSELNESDIAKQLFSSVKGIKHDDDLGYYSGLYVGHVTEGDFRSNGSSGGFGTWILSQLLKSNEVDFVINVVESHDSGKLFKYSISNSLDGVKSGAKTKYYPVEFSEVINVLKETPGRYAIVGLPSFIMELRLLAELDPIIKERLKYTVGLVCGHQKSTKFAEFLAWQCGIKPGSLEKINFRKKQADYPADRYAIEVTGKVNGETQTIVKEMRDLVGNDWGQGFFKVRASDFTDDVMNETADITLGDAWLPEYTQDSLGNNILIVRNPTIQQIISDGIRDNKVSVDAVNASTIYRSQASHFKHTKYELAYRLFKKQKNHEWYPEKRIQPSSDISLIRRKIQDQRETICFNIPKYYQVALSKNDMQYFINNANKLSAQYKRIYLGKRIISKLKRILHLKN